MEHTSIAYIDKVLTEILHIMSLFVYYKERNLSSQQPSVGGYRTSLSYDIDGCLSRLFRPFDAQWTKENFGVKTISSSQLISGFQASLNSRLLASSKPFPVMETRLRNVASKYATVLQSRHVLRKHYS